MHNIEASMCTAKESHAKHIHVICTRMFLIAPVACTA